MTRRETRDSIFKIIFRTEFNSPEEMQEQMELFFDEGEEVVSEKDREYISTKAENILSRLEEIDNKIETISTGWKLDRIGKTELAILRLAIYEMEYDEDIPKSVAINEAVELGKTYSDENAGSFINGLLAKLA